MTPTLALLALLIELMLGYPDWTFRAIGHPVTWIGRLIDALERTLNRAQDSLPTQRAKGIVALVILVAVGLIVLFSVPAWRAEPPKSSATFELGRGKKCLRLTQRIIA